LTRNQNQITYIISFWTFFLTCLYRGPWNPGLWMGRCCCILVRNRRLPLTSCHRRTSSPKSDSAGELTQTRRHLCGVSNGTMRNEHVKMRGTKDLPVLQKKKKKEK